MKIHNPNDLDLDVDLSALRAMVRGDQHPAVQAVEEHRDNKRQRGQNSDAKGRQARQEESASGKPALPAEKAPQPKASPPAVNARPSASMPATVPNPKSGAEKKAAPASGAAATEKSQATPATREDWESLNKKKKELVEIIRHCEALEILNPDYLAIPDYPGPESLILSKRRRDLWRLSILFFLGLSVLGLANIINAWVAGIAAGICVLLIAAATPWLRQFLPLNESSFRNLQARRKYLEHRALNHIKLLEGQHRLAWQCQRMQSINTQLSAKKYERLVLLSRQGLLIKGVRNVAAFRFYLQYLREAQKAFTQVKSEYLGISARLKNDFAGYADTDS